MNTVYFKSQNELFEATTSTILSEALEAVKERGVFSLVLSGGNTPLHLYRRMRKEPFLNKFPWDKTHFFWGDERQVPQDNPFSNCGSALALLPQIPEENIHRINTTFSSNISSASEYEKEILDFFEKNPSSEAFFDLILLGIGPDGHTASLFPGSDALEEKEKLVLSVPAPETAAPHVPRVTLTYPGLYRSRNILFIISGTEKVKLLENFDERYPAARVKSHGEIKWFIHE